MIQAFDRRDIFTFGHERCHVIVAHVAPFINKGDKASVQKKFVTGIAEYS